MKRHMKKVFNKRMVPKGATSAIHIAKANGGVKA